MAAEGHRPIHRGLTRTSGGSNVYLDQEPLSFGANRGVGITAHVGGGWNQLCRLRLALQRQRGAGDGGEGCSVHGGG